jgi:ferric-dicitrate binding protein FerR (iron transport regulator)
MARRRYAWAAVALVAAASLTLLFVFRAPPAGEASTAPAAVVESIVGTVWVHGTDTPVSRFLLADHTVPVGSGLRSSGGGRVSLLLSSGHSLKLDRSTQVRLLGDGLVALDDGRIYAASGTDHDDAAELTVTTPFGEVRGVRMQVEVRSQDDGLQVRLREGAVELVREGEELRIGAGEELTVDPQGTVTRRELATDGPEWDWLRG